MAGKERSSDKKVWGGGQVDRWGSLEAHVTPYTFAQGSVVGVPLKLCSKYQSRCLPQSPPA